jgi:hypothetical protein
VIPLRGGAVLARGERPDTLELLRLLGRAEV